MGVTRHHDTVRLEGDCDVAEAETLVALLSTAPAVAAVDASGAGTLHTAVVQALLTLRPRLAAPPPDPLMAACLAPLLEPVRVEGDVPWT